MFVLIIQKPSSSLTIHRIRIYVVTLILNIQPFTLPHTSKFIVRHSNKIFFCGEGGGEGDGRRRRIHTLSTTLKPTQKRKKQRKKIPPTNHKLLSSAFITQCFSVSLRRTTFMAESVDKINYVFCKRWSQGVFFVNRICPLLSVTVPVPRNGGGDICHTSLSIIPLNCSREKKLNGWIRTPYETGKNYIKGFEFRANSARRRLRFYRLQTIPISEDHAWREERGWKKRREKKKSCVCVFVCLRVWNTRLSTVSLTQSRCPWVVNCSHNSKVANDDFSSLNKTVCFFVFFIFVWARESLFLCVCLCARTLAYLKMRLSFIDV